MAIMCQNFIVPFFRKPTKTVRKKTSALWRQVPG